MPCWRRSVCRGRSMARTPGFHLFVNPSGLDVGPHNFDPTKIPLEDMKNQPKIAGQQAAAGHAGQRRGPQSARRRAAVMHAHRGRCGEHDGGIPRGDPHAEAGRRIAELTRMATQSSHRSMRSHVDVAASPRFRVLARCWLFDCELTAAWRGRRTRRSKQPSTAVRPKHRGLHRFGHEDVRLAWPCHRHRCK